MKNGVIYIYIIIIVLPFILISVMGNPAIRCQFFSTSTCTLICNIEYCLKIDTNTTTLLMWAY